MPSAPDVVTSRERPTIVFDEEAHTYHVNGEQLPSVTTIIKAVVVEDPDPLIWWGWRLQRDGKRPDHERQRSATVGKVVHKALEVYGETGVLPDIEDHPEDVQPRLMALAGFLLEHRPRFEAVEMATASLAGRYAGMFDGRVVFERGPHKGKRALIDAKNTSRIVPKKHYLQLAAYEYAENEWGEHTDLQAIVHLRKDGKHKVCVSDFTTEDWLAHLSHYDYLTTRGLA